MNQDAVAKLTDSELVLVINWALEEQKTRREKRKQDTIAKIRELARSIEIGVKIEGTRGRPPKSRSVPAALKPSKVWKPKTSSGPSNIRHISRNEDHN